MTGYQNHLPCCEEVVGPYTIVLTEHGDGHAVGEREGRDTVVWREVVDDVGGLFLFDIVRGVVGGRIVIVGWRGEGCGVGLRRRWWCVRNRGVGICGWRLRGRLERYGGLAEGAVGGETWVLRYASGAHKAAAAV